MTLSDEARQFAAAHRVARLATAGADGAPHVVPFCYAVAGDCFYFVIDDKPKRTRTGVKRLRNIAANPRVALVIDDYEDDWTRLAYLLVHGRAQILGAGAEYGRALQLLRARYPQYAAMPLAPESHPMVRITAERFHLWRFS